MDPIEKLSIYLKNRLLDLKRAKQEGKKVIGYTPGGYLPQELVIASGAIPICLIRGGDHSAVELAGAYQYRWLDTFCRAQIGYGVSGEDPYYNIIDLLVIPVTDNNIRAVMDSLDYHTEIDIFPYGVPHTKEDMSLKYYLHGITRLKIRLEELTGVEITEARLREAINLCNRERELLRKISLMRKSQPAPISSRDFVFLNHGSCLADESVMVTILEELCQELGQKKTPAKEGPRILLTGSTLALGDHKIHDIVEEGGANIVIEEFAEGIQPYWESVRLKDNLMVDLADCYFMRRISPAWFRPGTERLNFLVKLAKEFNVEGIIWYQLMYRESYKSESFYFPELIKRETDVPTLIVESDYDNAEVGPLRTRVETFIETLRS